MGSVLLHDISHIALWDIDPRKLQQFLISNGWSYPKGQAPKAPQKLILPDSSQSPSEDFANSVEIYYSNPKRFKEFNPKAYEILEGIIRSREKQ